MSELGENHQLDVEEGLVAHDRAINHRQELPDPRSDLAAIARTGQIGLASSGVLNIDLISQPSPTSVRTKDETSALPPKDGFELNSAMQDQRTGSVPRWGASTLLDLGLVRGVEEGGQGDIGFAVRVVESLEDIGCFCGAAGEEPLGAQNQPRIAVVGIGLEMRLGRVTLLAKSVGSP